MERLRGTVDRILKKRTKEPEERRDINGYPLGLFDIRLGQLQRRAEIEKMDLFEFFAEAQEIFEEDARRKEVWLHQQKQQEGG